MSLLQHLKRAVPDGTGWLLFNAAGIGIYLAIESWITAPRIPEEAFNGIDQICFWETLEFPLLAFYLGANVTWLLMASPRAPLQRPQPLIWLPTGLLWGGVIACDAVAVKIAVLVLPMMIKRAWDHHLGMA